MNEGTLIDWLIELNWIVREIDKLCPGSVEFSRRHPLACWVSSMLMCFATSFVSNFLVGESLVIPLKNHQELIVASAVWYDLSHEVFSRTVINVIPVIYGSEIDTINWLQFFVAPYLVHVSCKSGTGFAWYRILLRTRMLFHSKPYASLHWTGKMILCFLFTHLSLASIPDITIATTMMNSFTAHSAMFIFSASNFHSRCMRYKNYRQKMEFIYGALFWSVCHFSKQYSHLEWCFVMC